jgi:hypothetical protein
MKKVIFTLLLLTPIGILSAQTINSINSSNSAVSLCPGGSISIDYSASASGNPTVTIELSDASGSFSTPLATWSGLQKGNKVTNQTLPEAAVAALTTSGNYRLRIYLSTTTPTATVPAASGPTITITNPNVTNPGTSTFCSGTTGSIAFSGSNGATSFTWTAGANTFGLGTSGTGDISFPASNTGASNLSSSVVVTPWSGTNGTGCAGAAQTFSLVVKPIAWNGSGDWSTAANWACGSVPAPGTSVFIVSGTPTIPASTSINVATSPLAAEQP